MIYFVLLVGVLIAAGLLIERYQEKCCDVCGKRTACMVFTVHGKYCAKCWRLRDEER